MKRLLQITLLIVLLVPLMVSAQDKNDTTELRYFWERNTTGTYAIRFDVQRSIDGDTWEMYAVSDDTTCIVVAFVEREIRVRVRGVDQWDRVGPWSDPSDPHVPPSPGPGACGTPEVAIKR